MFDKMTTLRNRRKFRASTLGLVALCAMLVGFMVASNFQWTAVSHALLQDSEVQPSPTAPTMPSSFARLAEDLSPTVVNIKVTKVQKLNGPQWQTAPEGPFGDLFRHFFKEMPQIPENYRMQGAGSGVIISPDGYILTNNHVVEGATELTITLSDKQEYKARIVGRDPKTDLAVLRIDAKRSLPAAAMGDSDQLQIGDWVLAIGNPFGLSHTVTSGIVSAKGRVIGAGPYDDFIQTDASINPGNSGGPLFNMRGEVVGINTAIIPNGQGIGFAIPVNVAKPLIPQLVNNGEVTRGYLGVSVQSVTPDLDKALELKGRKGALVADVVSGSPAEQGGIHRGDLVVGFNKKAVESARDLSLMVARTPVGHKATVTVLREGVEQPLTITIGKLGADETKSQQTPQPAKGKWGLWLQDMNPQMAHQFGLEEDKGIVVVNVEPGSPAHRAGIQKGDMIMEVNRQAVDSVQEAKDVIAKANNSLLLLVKRDGGSFFVPLNAEA